MRVIDDGNGSGALRLKLGQRLRKKIEVIVGRERHRGPALFGEAVEVFDQQPEQVVWGDQRVGDEAHRSFAAKLIRKNSSEEGFTDTQVATGDEEKRVEAAKSEGQGLERAPVRAVFEEISRVRREAERPFDETEEGLVPGGHRPRYRSFFVRLQTGHARPPQPG